MSGTASKSISSARSSITPKKLARGKGESTRLIRATSCLNIIRLIRVHERRQEVKTTRRLVDLNPSNQSSLLAFVCADCPPSLHNAQFEWRTHWKEYIRSIILRVSLGIGLREGETVHYIRHSVAYDTLILPTIERFQVKGYTTRRTPLSGKNERLETQPSRQQ